MLYKGFLFGLTLQIAVGPVFFAVLNRALQYGFQSALAMTAGVALADAIYIAVSFTGINTLLMVPAVSKLMAYLAAAVLIIISLSYFHSTSLPDGSTYNPVIAKRSSFTLGLKLTLSNPLTIVFWGCTFGGLMASSHMSRLELMFFAIGCVLSTLVFLSTASLLSQPLKQLLKPRALQVMNYLVGLFLVGFAIKIALSV